MSRDLIDGGRGEKRPGVRDPGLVWGGLVGDRYLPPRLTEEHFFSFCAQQLSQNSICLSGTAATCVQRIRHLVGDLVTTSPENKLSDIRRGSISSR